jgi:hypothetical protein
VILKNYFLLFYFEQFFRIFELMFRFWLMIIVNSGDVHFQTMLCCRIVIALWTSKHHSVFVMKFDVHRENIF